MLTKVRGVLAAVDMKASRATESEVAEELTAFRVVEELGGYRTEYVLFSAAAGMS
jgi:hypothetical protein